MEPIEPVDKDGKPLSDAASKSSPQVPPIQSGSQYGGYGQSTLVFGRESGSSSEEGGQGESEEIEQIEKGKPDDPAEHVPANATKPVKP